MKCVACGAAMRLMQVANRHRHGVELSATSSGARPAHRGAQRLMFNRARMSAHQSFLPQRRRPRRRPSSFRRAGCGPERMDASDREARQQADGSQGTKGGGTDFGPAVRGQDTNHEHTDRAQSDAGASQAVGQQFPGLDESRSRSSAAGRRLSRSEGQRNRISDRLSAVKTPLNSGPIALRVTPAAAKPLANSSRPGRRRSRSSAADKLSSSEQQRPMWPARSTGCGTLCGVMLQWAHGLPLPPQDL